MSGPAVISCPSCKKRFKGKPELGGKRIKCPLCAEPFVVPNEAPSATTVGVVPPPPPAPVPSEDDPTYGIGHIDLAPRCPNCAKLMLNAEAVICVHCGYNTLTREHGETKKLIAITPQEHFAYLVPALSAAAGFLGIIIMMLFYNILFPDWLAESTRWAWIAHESIRMWTTTLLLGLLWGLGNMAFNTLAMRPKPPDVEKE